MADVEAAHQKWNVSIADPMTCPVKSEPRFSCAEFHTARDEKTAEKGILQNSSLRLSQLCGVTSSGKAGGPILSRDEPASCRCLAQLRKRNAFAGMRKRLVQQRFERVGCPTAKRGLHRGFQGPIHTREVTLGDLLAEQGFDRGSERGCHDMNRRRPSKRGKQRLKAPSPNANSSAPRPIAITRPSTTAARGSSLRAEQEDEDEEWLGWEAGWFVSAFSLSLRASAPG